MLKVTVRNENFLEIWELEGKLTGDWVIELERCWSAKSRDAGCAMRLNLKAVTFIDASGKKLLSDMHGAGVEINGCDCMTRAVVDEIIKETARVSLSRNR